MGTTTTTALTAAKKELRATMKLKLARIAPDAIQRQSHRITHTLLASTQFARARRIGIYLAMPTGEAQTDALVRVALDAGKQVFVPHLGRRSAAASQLTSPATVMDMVKLRSLADYEALQPDRWGIPSVDSQTVSQRERVLDSAPSTAAARLDLILVPGVAFQLDPESRLVRRLGHGKGFYDFFLHRYQLKFMSTSSGWQVGDTMLCGLALEEQYLDSNDGVLVPTDEHDFPLHALAVGNGEMLIAPLSENSTGS